LKKGRGIVAKVLIAEDDFMIAEMLQEAAASGGYEVCGTASRVSEVIALCEQHKPDLAIIDLRLAGGDDGLDAAAELAKRVNPGILYATGNCHRILEKPPAVGEACLTKPFTLADVVQALQVVEQIVRTGEAPSRLPRRLYLLRQGLASPPRDDCG
jgi:two-component system, response regulator PdtaR